MFGPQSIHGELETGMLRHFFQGTLGYVGLAMHQPFVAYHVPSVDDIAVVAACHASMQNKAPRFADGVQPED
jgi:putative NADPH-quinone reductase